MDITNQYDPLRAEVTNAPEQANAETAAQIMGVKAIGEQQINELMQVLTKYRAGKNSVDSRIIAAENWWKLRNDVEEDKAGHAKPGFRSKSGWLHNVITNKHADAMDAYPEPNILPREQGDKLEAAMLSKIIPVVLEKNQFETTYSKIMWSKLKTGTGVYKVIWDKNKMNGLGDISVEKCNILNLFWEPGVEDIQQSKYFFEVDFQDEDDVREMFPLELPEGKQIPHDFITSKFSYDDHVDTTSKVPVISAYYHKNGVLHYILFVPGTVLYATENDPERALTGWYDHGKYPYVFDALFPIEGSPCGYGYVDLCKAPQTEIDLLKTAYVENAMVGAKPRYFKKANCGVNIEQFTNLNESIVNVEGSLSEDNLAPITHDNLDGNYIEMLQLSINELRETSGNTETATGTTSSGVTAASAIAALQEASGKGSRDSTKGSYRAYSEVNYLAIELIRQFYDAPRQFRILGDGGQEMFLSYSNEGLQPQPQTFSGYDIGSRIPEFDIRIVPQKRTAYTKMSNNELALQFYGLGFFNPQQTDQALACLTMMDFDSIDDMRKTIKQNGTLFERFNTLLQVSAMLAAKCGDARSLAQIQMIAQQSNVQMPTVQVTGMPAEEPANGREHAQVSNARAQTREAAMPDGGTAS